MAGLSRTEKYKDLRTRLQDDTGSDLSTKALNPYESRLNQIDANNFAKPGEVLEDAHAASHAREVAEEPVRAPLHRTQHERVSPSYQSGLHENENSSATFDNDYLDQYIREVKQYNLEQGSALSDDTQVNVLRQLEKNQKPQNEKDRYAEYGSSPLNMPNVKMPKAPAELNQKKDTTAEIPFQSTQELPTAPKPEPVQASPNARVQMVHQNAPVTNTRKTFTEDLFENDDEADTQTAQNLTKEDIMAEVQNLVNGTKQPEVQDAAPTGNDAYDRNFDAERTARQQLLNETTQMRAQLDDYEDNLNEVSDKMRHTNQILNIVLVVLIIALAVILGIVIYWIVLSRGA
ncbi:MAG: hypothetical protein LKF53_02295 [Solobacterium sp.]|jgi:hypothetical protein|nr:hypothetical protein [Solobacterium sp.]MCH4205207.1 hypothetical protein [Solobacterium sp.]MCH4226800.1 hypothetical protein [Solobacterium sp.]MCH4281560.1 hypothetical protein [Solobacterium sp.]